MIPASLKSQYKTIKKQSIQDQEITTQVVVENTLRKKGFTSVATKILLQIIAKRNNILWAPVITIET